MSEVYLCAYGTVGCTRCNKCYNHVLCDKPIRDTKEVLDILSIIVGSLNKLEKSDKRDELLVFFDVVLSLTYDKQVTKQHLAVIFYLMYISCLKLDCCFFSCKISPSYAIYMYTHIVTEASTYSFPLWVSFGEAPEGIDHFRSWEITRYEIPFSNKVK
jgi:hypothetical protein